MDPRYSFFLLKDFETYSSIAFDDKKRKEFNDKRFAEMKKVRVRASYHTCSAMSSSLARKKQRGCHQCQGLFETVNT